MQKEPACKALFSIIFFNKKRTEIGRQIWTVVKVIGNDAGAGYYLIFFVHNYIPLRDAGGIAGLVIEALLHTFFVSGKRNAPIYLQTISQQH